MYKKHNSLLTALLLISSFEASALQINGIPAANSPVANDDYISTVAGLFTVAEGSLAGNDQFGTIYSLDVSWVGQYGLITSFDSEGEFTYELFDSTTNDSLPPEGIATDRFKYTYFNESGLSDTAWIIIEVHFDPNTFHPETGGDFPYDNVDIEFNDRSAQATPLNSARNIKGHLHNSGDKDWYTLPSTGNEIITLEVCPIGTSCFGKKSWVLYVFDSEKLNQFNYPKPDGSTGNLIEEQNFQFSRWLNDTGNTIDESGQAIINGNAGISNHMYLNYRTGSFQDALIGVIDPCFGTSNTVDIGAGDGARNYFIAISSPLLGDGNNGTDETECGAGSIVLEDPAAGSALGTDAEGAPKTYTFTEQFISVFPNSDDQYSIKVTGTGRHPLLSETAAANSATYSSREGTLYIPSVRVEYLIYKATLTEQDPIGPGAHSLINGTKFNLSDIAALSNDDDVVDAYRATYNSEKQEVIVPRITDTESGVAYSVTLQYHAADDGDDAWLEVTSTTEIQ